jgi:hypothetical protein
MTCDLRRNCGISGVKKGPFGRFGNADQGMRSTVNDVATKAAAKLRVAQNSALNVNELRQK